MMALRSQDKRELLAQMEPAEEFVLVDGYNIIFAWDELKGIGRDSLDAARHVLMNLLCNYQGYRGCNLILVFDAYKVPQNLGTVEKYHNIFIVYTQEAETADSYIERVTYELRGRKKVRVATSDNLEQLIILGHGRGARLGQELPRRGHADPAGNCVHHCAEQPEKQIERSGGMHLACRRIFVFARQNSIGSRYDA